MHNLSTILRKFTEITKTFAGNLVDKDGNIPRRGPKPMFSDIEVIALRWRKSIRALTARTCFSICFPSIRRIFPT